ncbi:MAG TPA: preprotein translocase subunit SecG [Rhodospirillales bacterium]|nr:preprotein translocase subunit SecG [Rhodospirillales bacterium]
MATVVLVIHLFIAIALVGVILIQRSEGGGLGIGGGTFGGLTSGRGAANLLTRTTAILAASFIGTSLILAILAGNATRTPIVLDQPAPATAPAPQEEEPAVPSAPVAQ